MFTEKPHQAVVFLGASMCGKSSVAGQVAYELGGVWNDRLEMIRQELIQINQLDAQYARIMDRRKDEKDILMTKYYSTYAIETNAKAYTLINVPGKFQHLKEILIGIALADIAVLVLSGIREQNLLYYDINKFFLRLCYAKRIRNIICVIHKIDETQYNEVVFNQNVEDVKKILKEVGYNQEIPFIPTSIRMNQNIKNHHQTTQWYNGPSLIEALDTQNISNNEINYPLRILIHGGHRIPGIGTIALGKVIYGIFKQDSIVQIEPVPLKAEIGSIETHHFMLEQAIPNQLIGIRLKNIQHLEIKNGQVCSTLIDSVKECQGFIAEIKVSNDFKYKIKKGHAYTVFLNTILIQCKIDAVLDNNQNESPIELIANDSGILKLTPIKPVSVENYSDYPKLGCIAFIDNRKVIAMGIIIQVITKQKNQLQ